MLISSVGIHPSRLAEKRHSMISADGHLKFGMKYKLEKCQTARNGLHG